MEKDLIYHLFNSIHVQSLVQLVKTFTQASHIKKALFLLAFLCSFLELKSQDIDEDMPEVAGKCFAKCIAPYDTYEISIPVYIGNDKSIYEKYVFDTMFQTKAEGQKWERKNSIKQSNSSYNNDSYKWCLVDTDEEVLTVTDYLRDTTVTKDFIIEYYEITDVNNQYRITEWLEIACTETLSKEFFKELRIKLGLPVADLNEEMDALLKQALVEYQEKHGLPIGALDLQTLNHLGVDY